MMIIHCIPFIYGCTDTSAVNYTANANTDDGSCCFFRVVRIHQLLIMMLLFVMMMVVALD